MTALLNDIRFGIRFLKRSRAFSVTAIGILALGLSLSATLLAIVKGALLDPWPYRGYDRILTFRASYPEEGRTVFPLWSAREVDDLGRETDLFEHVIAGTAREMTIAYADKPEHVKVAVLTPNAFAMLGVQPLLGRALDERDGIRGAPPVVVLSHHLWRTRLGADPRVIGSTLRLGGLSSTIVGVMPPPFVFWDSDLWTPLALDLSQARTDRRLYVQAQLRAGVTLGQAAAGLTAFAQRLRTDHPDVREYRQLTIAIEPLVENVLRDLRPTLYLLVGAVVLVLLVAAANIANAMLAKGTAREGELAVRRALGASAFQIARQLLVEGALIGGVGALVGVWIASFLLPQIVSLIPYGYVPAEAHIELDWPVLATIAVVAFVCGLLFSSVPAIRAAAAQPSALLRGSDARTASRRSHRWAQTFTIAQLALAVVVLGVSIAAAVRVNRFVARDPGFVPDKVWTGRVALPSAAADAAARASAYQQLQRALVAAPGARAVALASEFPVGELPRTLVSVEPSAKPSASTMDVDTLAVSPTFFDLLQLPLVEGRVFDEHDQLAAPRVAVVTSTLAHRLFPNASAIGRRIAIGESAPFTSAAIVGIVGDVRAFAADETSRPTLFEPLLQRPPATVVLGIKSDGPEHAATMVARAIATVDPQMPIYETEMLEQLRVQTLGPQLLAAFVLGLFGAAVLALSAFGIFAVMSQSVADRRREMAIRMTLGADRWALFRGEMVNVARLVGASGAFGAIAAFVILRLLAARFVMFPSAVGAPVSAAVAAVAVIAVAAAAIPAARACRNESIVPG